MSKQTTDGIIAFCVQIKIEATQMSTWEPERIKAFFDGLAQAKSAAEGEPIIRPEEPTT